MLEEVQCVVASMSAMGRSWGGRGARSLAEGGRRRQGGLPGGGDAVGVVGPHEARAHRRLLLLQHLVQLLRCACTPAARPVDWPPYRAEISRTIKHLGKADRQHSRRQHCRRREPSSTAASRLQLVLEFCFMIVS